MKNIPVSPRIISVLIFAIAVFALVCFGLYTFADPQFARIATETNVVKTQDAGFAEATNAVGTLNADATTISFYKTQTAIPTPTLTATQPPELVSCSVELQSGAILYTGPSEGFASKRIQDMKTSIIAYAKNTNWYKIEEQPDGYMWVQKKFVNLDDSCEPVAVSLSYLAGWGQDQQVVLEENFSTTYSWVGSNNKLVFPLPFSQDKNMQVLPVSGESRQMVSLKNQPFPYLGNLIIHSSFYWARSGKYGYRIWGDDVNYYDILVNQNCEIELYDSGEPLLQRLAITKKFCYYDNINYFEIGVSKDGILSMKLNEIEPYLFQLENIYQGEQFALVADEGALAEVEYVVITTTP